MRKFGWAFTVLTAVLVIPLAWSNDDGWRLRKDQDDIKIYSRAVEGWDVHEIRGVTRIAGRLSSVVAVINDVPATHELSDVVARSEIKHSDSDTRYQIYSIVKLPWPVSDRDILTKRQIIQDDKTLVVTITDTATDGVMPPASDLVRIVKSRQQWTLTPATDGGVAVELRLLSDPAGPIPASLINAMSVSTPFNTLSMLKVMVLRPQYAHASLPFIKDDVSAQNVNANHD